ncbi:hypothetical protein V5P93_007249 [Actinokineospora auranticolor]|uniref:Uncharacterized protein n=1 Tax=Actinokineospora auranticolor TaxID=155976 RepID=A0A2S6GRM0_9PSEU|nr:hypothetical protein [Actinokineospora auranticolor]PPK67905.1 hypothetical protein CLV40_106136 [Actinokineospora auranticolor]
MADVIGGAPGQDPDDDAFGDIFEHPDLRDEVWLAQARKRAARDAKRARLRGAVRFRRRRRGWAGRTGLNRRSLAIVTVTGLALLVVGLVVVRDAIRDERTSALYPDAVDLTRPYAGTPAADWADGEAGLVPPQAHVVGTHSADEVADAYESVRRFLVASRLDPAVLEGHDTDRVLRLLTPAGAEWARSRTGDGRQSWVSWIADGNHLLPAPPKVSGQMQAGVGDHGQLVIYTDYMVTYAFATSNPEKLSSPYDILVLKRTSETFEHSAAGLTITEAEGFTSLMSCSDIQYGALAPEYEARDSSRDAVDPPANYFDLRMSVDVANDCARRG